MGSSPSPMDNYRLVLPEDPTGYRTPTPDPTLHIEGGAVVRQETPDEVRFRDDDGLIRPVCPFFEVWARLEGEEVLVPLTNSHLAALGLDPAENVRWNVRMGNIKAFRRTGVDADKILADTERIEGFDVHTLEGRCENFVGGLSGDFIPLGKVQYIRPTDDFGQIQLRFTPATGKVYGPTGRGEDPNVAKALYDAGEGRGTWHLHQDGDDGTPPFTNPGGIYGQRRNENGQLVDENGTVITRDNNLRPVNLGYLDDSCDGIISVEITGTENPLSAYARVSVGPPDFAPDSLSVRTVQDELEQFIRGTQANGSVTVEEAADILRRAMETVRLMNTVYMNGPGGLPGHLRSFDPSRRQFWTLSSPEQTDRRLDPRRIIAHHSDTLEDIIDDEEISFEVNEFIRRSERVGELTDEILQKMPAMMRGSDGMPLALTKRQRAKLDAGTNGLEPDGTTAPAAEIVAVNLTAQISRPPSSPNPISVYPESAIANCFPGLEFDFRNVWRRIFEGITLHESNFTVVSVEGGLQQLVGTILFRIDGRDCFARVTDQDGNPATRPVLDENGNPVLDSDGNPVLNPLFTNLEWTNALAHVAGRPGEEVDCEFQLSDNTVQSHRLTVRNLLDRQVIDDVVHESAVIDRDMAEPGELTQGLCSPWQADFRECGCYYWAASRPDYVNSEVVDGVTEGHSWLLKNRQPDTTRDSPRDYESHPYQQMITYDDLYQAWETELSFVIEGKDENRM